MAITCFVGDHISIDVGDPGYGYLGIYYRPDPALEDGAPGNRDITLRGRHMWRALESLTQLACRDAAESPIGAVDGLWSMSVGEARAMLPQFQTAVLYAAAGSDVAERLHEDDAELHDVLCSRCHQGSPYDGEVTKSEWCEQYGHQPFGYFGSWEQGQETALSDRRWAEIVRPKTVHERTVPTDSIG